MDFNPLLGPVVALACWTILVLLWFAIMLLPGLIKGWGSIPKGTRVRDIADLPGAVQWKNHNYMHLVEQPTVFYALVLSLILMGDTQPFNLTLAWAYVGLRVLHSLVQATINKVELRFVLFIGSTLCLIGLALHAAMEAFHHLG